MFEEHFTWQNLLTNPQKTSTTTVQQQNCQRIQLKKFPTVSELVIQFYFRPLARKLAREKNNFININKKDSWKFMISAGKNTMHGRIQNSVKHL